MNMLAAAGLILGLLGFQGGPVTDGNDILKSLPERIPGWTSAGEDAVYDRETLYDYMDGGAEVYLAFDFQRVYVRKYVNPDGDEISLDIYDMGSSPEAFGIFSCDREDETAGIGQASEYGYGLLRLWQGRFFVSVLAATEDAAAEKTVLALGEAAAAALGPAGSEPEMLSLLPKKALKRDRISYFHADVNLNNRYFISSDNILKLNRATECVFAEYETGAADPISLLVIRYPGPDAAIEAHRSFLAGYLPDADDKGQGRMEDGTWTVVQRHDALVAVIFDAPDDRIARELLAGFPFER